MTTRLTNWRGGLLGVAAFLTLNAVFFLIAFLTAMGNDTPGARATLKGIEVFFVAANPIWALPLSYIVGSYWITLQVPESKKLKEGPDNW